MSDVPSLILQGIRDYSASRPRALQKEVGPSQLGNPCDHCLAAALAGWEKAQDEAWLPLIGTAVHALLLGEDSPYQRGWLREQRVQVGTAGGLVVHGNADLFHIPSGTVVDFKIVGPSTLNEARRHGSKLGYTRQIHLYGWGLDSAGYQVNTVIIAYLPRNSMKLTGNWPPRDGEPTMPDAFFDVRPYDEQVALDTLARAEQLVHTMNTFAHVSERARDVFIDSLPRAAGCYDCARYVTPVHIPRPLSDLHDYVTGGDHDNGR